jgi:DNA (cytosine-5)-methyltransferase 1
MNTGDRARFDKAAQKVLRKHWKDVPIYEDVTTLTGDQIGAVDIITGGFPCQDISLAGKGAGLAGERSGLWFEFHRLIKETKPKWVIAENVSALRSRGLDQVLRSLSEIGYDAEWYCIPASAVGAPHRRDRIWIVAYSSGFGLSGQRQFEQSEHSTQIVFRETIESEHGRISEFWKTEPNVGRVADGIPNRVDRLKQLGNAVVPQIPELIGRAILNVEDKTL